MISTKSLVVNISDVPITWAFEFYLNLPQQLSGQDIMIKSPFSPKDKIPSCSIYWHIKLGRYQFKDYSSGEGGSCQDLVRKLFDLNPVQAMFKMIEDYNQFILDNKGSYSVADFREHSKYKVTGFAKREWTILDKDYWYKQYKLGSNLLTEYNIYPLESYRLEKEESGELKILNISGYNIYGYFRADGVLYKIYQPKVRDKKFIKIREYIQGTDQLTYTKPTLIISSSLKDLMCLVNYKWNLESIAPNSENTLIHEHMIYAYKHKYKNIFTLFDNDEAGVKASLKYKDKYSIPSIELKGEKDLSDNIEKIGKEATGIILKDLIKTKLKENEALCRGGSWT